jgi:hypothetical protein
MEIEIKLKAKQDKTVYPGTGMHQEGPEEREKK